MSKRKYFRGKRLLSVSDFDQSESLYFLVNFGSKYPKTVHRAFLISWQYRTLMNFIVNGRIWEARKNDDTRSNRGLKDGKLL